MMDVSGRRLEDAIRLLKFQGFERIQVTLTASPRLRDKGFNADSRVIRQELSDQNIVELLVCNLNS
jgi:beta-lactam-binding protein with PASTA domain